MNINITLHQTRNKLQRNGGYYNQSRQRITLQQQVVSCEASTKQPKVLILGGTGRVGSSTALALKRWIPNSQIALGGRTYAKYNKTLNEKPDLTGCTHKKCDIDIIADLNYAVQGFDLIVHTAGPFQHKEHFNVIEAAINNNIPYIDVCDDVDYSQELKAAYTKKAEDKGVPAITTAGIYPGASNLMAATMIRKNLAGDPEMKPKKVQYNYFTAGSGGVGPTILETSFLLAGEEVVVYEDGNKVMKLPVSERKVKDFGKGVGFRSTYLYNLPEVLSTYQEFEVPNVSARFGTDPEIWNIGMALLPQVLSKEQLSNRDFVRNFGQLVGGMVSAVDLIVGEKVAMLVEIDYFNGKNTCGLFYHRKLSESVGNCVAAFAVDLLEHQHKAGVYFPESIDAVVDVEKFFERAQTECRRFILNKPKWFLDSEAAKVGMGIYI